MATTSSATSKAIYANDFFTGILAGLATHNVSTLSLRSNRLDKAFAQVFKDLQSESGDLNLDLRFRIRLHNIHGDSETVQQGLYEAAQRNIVSLDNPEFQDVRLRITLEDAEAYLAGVPGPADLYKRLAGNLIKYYRSGS